MMSELKEGVYMKLQKYSMVLCYARDVALKICLSREIQFLHWLPRSKWWGIIKDVIDSQL
jgi:hypothetical protein